LPDVPKNLFNNENLIDQRSINPFFVLSIQCDRCCESLHTSSA